MSVQVKIVASGSSGNCYWVSDGETRVLIDAGIRTKDIERGLDAIGERADAIEHVLISHSHTDHVAGLKGFINRYQPRVWMTAGTERGLVQELKDTCGVFTALAAETITEIGGSHVLPLRVPHDDEDPVGFVLVSGGVRLAFIADVGEITVSMSSVIRDVDFLFLESNHIPEWTASNEDLPERLRHRIGLYHLSNNKVEQFIFNEMCREVRHLVLGHLSGSNNSEAAVYEMASRALSAKSFQTRLSVIGAGAGSGVFTV